MGRAHAFTHAGGLVYRLTDSGPEFLLVTARRLPNAWVYPKGHIEYGEDPEDTAVREVKEEAGVSARVVRPLGQTTLDSQHVRWFLMKGLKEGPAYEGRRILWLPAEKAIDHVSFDDLRALLRKALRILRPVPSPGL